MSRSRTDRYPSTFQEKHFTVRQLAELWSISSDSVRRLFPHEPGVFSFQQPRKNGKRPYRTLLIPESVAERVYRRGVKP